MEDPSIESPPESDAESVGSSQLEPHHVVAAIHIKRLAGYSAGQIAGEKQRGAAHFQLIHVAMQRERVRRELSSFRP